MSQNIKDIINEVRTKRLKSLVLGGEELTEFPSEILTFDWLEELVFGCYYDFEEGEFRHLDIGIGKCRLRNLPKELGKLKNLKLLSLSGSLFGGVKPDIEDFEPVFELSNLEYLYLGNTKIQDISKIDKLSKIKHLDLSHTLISDFTPIEKLHNIEVLQIGDNNIDNIDFLTSLVKLRALSLTTNKLLTINSILNNLNMIRLCVCNNPLSDMSPLAEMKSLKYLCCNNLKIENFEFLKSLPNLEDFSLPYPIDFQLVQGNIKLKELFIENLENHHLSQIENYTNCESLHIVGTFDKFSLSSNLCNINSLTIDSPNLREIIFEEDKVNSITIVSIMNAPITSIMGFEKLVKLENIQFENTINLTDLYPIANITTLQSIQLTSTGVSDLTPLLKLLSKDNFEITLSENSFSEDLMNSYYESGKQGIVDYYQNKKLESSNS
jgi:internalin A